MLPDKKREKYFFLSQRRWFNCIPITIKGKVLQHFKNIYIWPKDFSCLFIRLHGKNLHKKDVMFHYASEGKPLNNQDQGILKLVSLMDNKTDELMGVEMERA